jgi:hypothetical protein
LDRARPSVKDKVFNNREETIMQEFIQIAVKQLGISEDTATSATGAVLNLLNQKAGDEVTSGLMSKLPGAEALLSASSSGSSSAGSGGLLGGLGSMLGGKLGGAAGALAALQGSGLDSSQMGSFVTMLVEFVKQKAGTEVVDGLLEKVPDLKGLLR